MQLRLAKLVPRGELGREVVDPGTGLEGLEKIDESGDRGEPGRMMVRVVVYPSLSNTSVD